MFSELSRLRSHSEGLLGTFASEGFLSPVLVRGDTRKSCVSPLTCPRLRGPDSPVPVTLSLLRYYEHGAKGRCGRQFEGGGGFSLKSHLWLKETAAVSTALTGVNPVHPIWWGQGSISDQRCFLR